MINTKVYNYSTESSDQCVLRIYESYRKNEEVKVKQVGLCASETYSFKPSIIVWFEDGYSASWSALLLSEALSTSIGTGAFCLDIG